MRLRAAVAAASLAAAALTGTAAGPAAAGTPTLPAIITVACPGPQCPYDPPTPDEAGAAADILARIDLERAEPQRDYVYDGAVTALAPLSPASATAEATAQAAAEWEADNDSVEDYGHDPPGYSYLTAANAADSGDSAGIDNGIMHSYGHALAMLSAAPTQVAIGVACAPGGLLYVTELFLDPDKAIWTTGQSEFAAELAQNNVYVQSGGTVTTVTDTEGTGPAQYSLPQQPVVAGYTGSGLYATGVDWTCSGPHYPPGEAPESPLPPPVTSLAPGAGGAGYWLSDAGGAIDEHGASVFHGSAARSNPTSPVVGMSPTADGGGYWQVSADGGVFAFGDAPYLGSLPGLGISVTDVVALVPSPAGGGYWVVSADGGVFAFGDAPYLGSLPGLGVPITDVVAAAADPTGDGYWLFSADGGVFAFGDAPFLGSLPGLGVWVTDVVGGALDPSGAGYWLVGRDGGVFAFGDAPFDGAD